MNERGVLNLIRNDKWMMNVLETAEKLRLPQWVIGAGFVRNKVWNHLSGKNDAQHSTDIDLVYFDPIDIEESTEKALEKKLKEVLKLDWSVKNQARMHLVNGDSPYLSTEDALAHWPETATAIGVNKEGENLRLVKPYGIEDLVNMIVRSSLKFKGGLEGVKIRAAKKRWLEMWPELVIQNEDN